MSVHTDARANARTHALRTRTHSITHTLPTANRAEPERQKYKYKTLAKKDGHMGWAVCPNMELTPASLLGAVASPEEHLGNGGLLLGLVFFNV